MAVSKSQFEKTLKSLEDVLSLPESDVTRDAAIQRFEFSVELAWKLCKKIMGSSSSAPKEIVREMAQNAYIEDIDSWLKSIDMRNLSSHAYNEEVAIEVHGFTKTFLPLLQKLKEKLDEK